MGSVTYRFEADASGAVEAFRKMTTAQQQAEMRSAEYALKLKRMGSDVDNLGERGQRAFVGWATSLVSFGAAAAAVKAGLERLNAEMEKAGQLGRENAPHKMSLFQLTGGDPDRAQFLTEEMKKSRLEVGMTAQDAADLQMTLTSAGQEKHREYFAGFQAIIDPNAIATGASKLSAGYGEGAVGGLRAASNKLLKAGEISGVKTDLIAPAISEATQIAQEIGSAHEELLGVVSQMTFATKSPEIAVTRLRSLGQKLGELGLGGEGFIAGAERLRPEMEAMDQPERLKHLGSVEAFMGYKWIIDNKDKAANAIREIRQAGEETGPGDLSDRMKALIDLPAFTTEKAARAAAISEQFLQTTMEDKESAARNIGNARRFDIQRRAIGRSGIYRQASEFVGWASETGPIRAGLGEEQSAGLTGSVETAAAFGQAVIGDIVIGVIKAMNLMRHANTAFYGPTYFLGERQDLHRAGAGGPAAGLD